MIDFATIRRNKPVQEELKPQKFLPSLNIFSKCKVEEQFVSIGPLSLENSQYGTLEYHEIVGLFNAFLDQ